MKNLLTLDETAKLAKVSKVTLQRRIKENAFPKPVKVPRTGNRGPKTVNRWKREDVMQWLNMPMTKVNVTPTEPEPGTFVAQPKPPRTDHGAKSFWENYALLALISSVAILAAYTFTKVY